MACWATNRCFAYLGDHGVAGAEVATFDVYFAWPEAGATSETWLKLADSAFDEVGTPGADVLALAAYEGAVRSANCDRDSSGHARAHALKIKLNPTHDVGLDKRLDRLIDSPWLLCDKPVKP